MPSSYVGVSAVGAVRHGCVRALATIVVSASIFAGAHRAVASCNLIPAARAAFGSEMGGVASPIAAPDRDVLLTVTPSCDGSPGFESDAFDNLVEIRFVPPGGSESVVNTFGIATADCTLAVGRCRQMTFRVPASVATTPLPHGLAGPARVTVTKASGAVLALINELQLPTTGCDESPDNVFQHFTIVPAPNNFADLADGDETEIFATVDGGGSLLVPLDYWGDGVAGRVSLPARPGSPTAKFIEGAATLPAQGAGDPNTIGEVIAAQSNSTAFLRSYTLEGRPLPPLFRVTDDGTLFGTIDAAESVLRIARNDGQGGPDLFDLSDRFSNGGIGPIVISAFSAAQREPLPLISLRSSAGTVAYTRIETAEGADFNLDSDTADMIVQLVDAQTAVGLRTNVSVGLSFGPLSLGLQIAIPPIAAGDDFAAFLERENSQEVDRNSDGDLQDNYLRVFSESSELTMGQTLEARLGESIDGAPVAASGSVVFFRSGASLTAAADPPGSFLDFLTVSPDGGHLYAPIGNIVYIYAINSLTSALTAAGSATIAPRDGISDLVFSPDSAHAYITSDADDAVIAYSRNPLTGALTFVDVEEDGVSGVTGLESPNAVAISPDGKHVYVTSYFCCGTPSAVSVFARNVGTGALTFVQSVFDGSGGVDGIGGANGVVVSVDGDNVYVIGKDDEAAATFARNTTTGALTFVSALAGAGKCGDLHPTSDGELVYAESSVPTTGITALERDQLTGELTIAPWSNGCGPYVAQSMALSAGENHILAGDSNVTMLFTRGANSQEPTMVETFRSPPFIDYRVAAPDPRYFYAIRNTGGSSQDTIVLVRTNAPVAAYKIGSGAVLTGPDLQDVSVAAERAVGKFSEESHQQDVNVDGDMDDDIAVIFDASGIAGQTHSLAVAVSATAISETVVALAVSEFDENAVPRNVDGDAEDDVLAITPADGSGGILNVGVAVDDVGATGTYAIAITPEAAEPAGNPGCTPTAPVGGCDLNGDADALDRVLRLYHINDGFREIGQAAEDFIASDRYVAFRTPEDDQPGTAHLNSDGADGDMVMQLFDLQTGDLIATKRSAHPCDFIGCNPLEPYKIDPLRDTLIFITREADEGPMPIGDLDGDGDNLDYVLTVFSITARRVQSVAKVLDNGAVDLAVTANPFPGQGVSQDLAYVAAHECDLGVDVNDDGDTDCEDVVLMLVGDSDGDGLLDEFDTCVEGYNPDGIDADADGLGDSACDLDVNACPPAPAVGCKQSPPGQSSLSFSDVADDAKDKLTWKWKNGDETQQSELGNPVDGATFYELCLYDGSGALQPLRQATVPPGLFCNGKRCWKLVSSKSVGFKDKLGFPDGIQKLSIAVAASGDGKGQVKGKGARLDLPAVPVTSPLTAQLFAMEDGIPTACWEATFSAPTDNDAGRYKAKND